MFLVRSKGFCLLAATAVLTVALVVLAVAGCGNAADTSATTALTTASTSAPASTSASTAASTPATTLAAEGSTSSTAAGSQTTAATAATQAQAGGAQALTDLLNTYKKVQSVSLDFTMTTGSGAKTTGTMWSEAGKNLKVDVTVNGMEMVMLINLVDKTMTEWQPSTKQGTKVATPAVFTDPSSYLNTVDISQVKDLGTEDVNGETCRVIQFTTTTGGQSIASKMWLSEKVGFPVRVETSGTGSNATTMTMNYTNVKVGPLPSDTFTVPADVTIATQ